MLVCTAANDVTKQKDMTRFHKHLFNQIASDHSDVKVTDKDKEKREKQPDRSSTHRAADGAPSLTVKQRHKSESVHKDIDPTSPERNRTEDSNQDRLESSTESHRRHSSNDIEHRDSIDKDSEATPISRPLHTGEASSDNSTSKESLTMKVDKEERRKVASAKRTNEEAQMSARERYMARKKAKLAKPNE